MRSIGRDHHDKDTKHNQTAFYWMAKELARCGSRKQQPHAEVEAGTIVRAVNKKGQREGEESDRPISPLRLN
jgi:hypothetical protein